MQQSFRTKQITELVRQNGKVSVNRLAKQFDVTVQTIRRDLALLAELGQVERVHGGAVLPSGVRNIGYEERRAQNTGAKHQIAKACARGIPNNISLFLNIGTSTEAVAAELLHHRNLMVVTNNLNVANILAGNPDCEVIVTGGSLRRSDGGLVGKLASDSIQGFKFDLAVIGCSALDQDGDMLDFDIHEVGVSQSILEQSKRTFLVADHSKFSRSAPVRIGSLKQVDQFFTDQSPPNDLAVKCRGWGTGLVISP